MGGQGRVSAMFATTSLVLSFLLVASQTELTRAVTVFKVGDAGGWTFGVSGWPKGKTFRADDTLVFNYSPGVHNVVAVNNVGYQNCVTPKGSKVYTGERDNIKLVKGRNSFICNFPGHCESGMKITVNAL